MSHFVFGNVCQNRTSEESILRPSSIVQLALKVGLFVRLDRDIDQPNVYEMLGEQALDGIVLFEFLLTAKEGDDTSDSLISPYQLDQNQLVENLLKIERWTSEVLHLIPSAQMNIYFTEGYDESFKMNVAAYPGWGENVAKRIYEESYVESIGIQAKAEA